MLAPAAVLCALATFAVIFFAPVSTALEAAVSRSPGVASLPMRLVSRHAAVFAAPVALLTLAVAVSTFASGYQATWSSFLADNLLPVTLGNIVGGGVMIGILYWTIFHLLPARKAGSPVD